MATQKPTPIPIPLSSFPGSVSQESAGRLINCTAEPLGEGSHPTGSAMQVWRRQPGLTQFNLQQTGQTLGSYRGGIAVGNVMYEAWANNAATISSNGTYAALGAPSSFPGTSPVTMARNLAANPDVIAVDIANGIFIFNSTAVTNATITATVGGSTLTSGDTVNLVFNNPGVNGLPVTVTYTLGAGETTTTIATGLKNAINNNTTLSASSITATSSTNNIPISQPGSIGNQTLITEFVTGVGNETITFNGAGLTGQMSGGAGTSAGTAGPYPQSYTFGGILINPTSVCFQDGYFFFTTSSGQVFASGINNLTMNALSFINVVSHADIALQRGIAYSNQLLLFTTGSLEIWQDTVQPYPYFPYSRIIVFEYGLIQQFAVAGWETGFSELCWVAQDFGVYWMTPTALSSGPIKVSPPDLDRAIEAEIKKGNTLRAGCYIFGGKKFWVLSSPDVTWEFNLSTKKWNERQSFNSTTGAYGQWRGIGGHPGTLTGTSGSGKWFMGDLLSANLIYPDDSNFTELGTPQLFRVESGPVRDFPNQIRVARADFDFDMGVGLIVATTMMTVLGAVAGAGNQVELTVNSTANVATGDTVNVSGVLGTTEANGAWTVTLVDSTHIILRTSVFVNTYTGGGVAIDVTQPANAVSPSCAISMSKNGGISWGNPLIRRLGAQLVTKGVRASVKNMGLTGPQGSRWRIDVTDPVYVGLLGATQSSDPRNVGA
jgi:hypothetical protein